jgi:hypothetical protein
MISTAPHPIRDDELDRLLEAALSVSPSPTFRARVAARVAEEPMPGRRRNPLIWPAMAAATAFATVLIVMTGPPGDEAPRAPHPPIAGMASWIVSAPATSIERRGPAQRRSTDSLAPRRVAARFDHREQEAFAWLVTRAKAGDLAPREIEIEAVELEPVVSPLAVPPLEVTPIGLTDDSEGDPQP